ncbi:UNVERIFIED_CONTAM: hypothetical protein ABIC26_001849 [Paenibacillus sp. PvR008]
MTSMTELFFRKTIIFAVSSQALKCDVDIKAGSSGAVHLNLKKRNVRLKAFQRKAASEA